MYLGVLIGIQELFEANLLLLVSFFMLYQKLRLQFRAVDHDQTSQILFDVLTHAEDHDCPWKAFSISQISMIELYQFIDRHLTDITHKIVANRRQTGTTTQVNELNELKKEKKVYEILKTRLYKYKWLLCNWLPIMFGVLCLYFSYKLVGVPIAWAVWGWADDWWYYNMQEPTLLKKLHKTLNEPLPDFDEE
jgi:hypothetical protein